MSHHYVQQIIHVIWSTQNQKFIIPQQIINELCGYVSTVIKSKGGKLYLGGGHDNHLHCLLSLPPTISISTMMQFIKSSSSKWIKYQKPIDPQFSWENGYTAFSIQDDRVDAVYSYIKNEEKRHEKISYRDEILSVLRLQNIQFEEKYFLERSHSKLLSHIIWSTKNRDRLIEKSMRPFLYQAMSDAASRADCIMHAIGGVEDHVHLLIEISRTTALSDLVREIKSAAICQLRNHSFNDFDWQTGFSAFSISLPTIGAVKQYIAQQEEHHKQYTYADKLNEFILKKGVI